MTEQFRPSPEKPKQNSPEAGAGSLGKPPPPGSEQVPQGGRSKRPELPPQLAKPQDLEILTKFREASELFGKLPYPLAPEMLDEMIRSAVKEGWRKVYPDPAELQRQVEKMDEEVFEALQEPTLRKKMLGRD